MSYLLDLCDALAIALNEHNFAAEFTAVSDVMRTLELEEIGKRQVIVDPFQGQEGMGAGTRDMHQRILRPTIFVLHRKNVLESESYRDAFREDFELVDEIIDWLLTQRSIGLFDLQEPVENDPLFSDAHMRERTQFTSAIVPRYCTFIQPGAI